MPNKEKYEWIYDDYAQSANTLFHFMKKPEYLKEILLKKAIVPRYCKENMDYLSLCSGSTSFREVLVLQKCFCDIPFHKLTENFYLRGEGENYEKLTDEEKKFLSGNNTHPDFYGEYGIAFSKSWGERQNLQPIHYLSEQSQYTKELSGLVEYVLNADEVPDLYADDILNRLSFVKPLRGIMKRKIRREGGEELEVSFYKNFHDEQEWRYVPGREALAAAKVEQVIANPHMLRMNEDGMDINAGLAGEAYSSLWLKYSYEDIRYIIVPDANARIDMIRTILSVPEDKFSSQSDISMQKHILISKILVLTEIRKDW